MMKAYLQNGLTQEVESIAEVDKNQFYILFLSDDFLGYIYPGIELIHTIQDKLVCIYDLIDDSYIIDKDVYLKEVEILPRILSSVGLGSVLGIDNDGVTNEMVERFFREFSQNKEYEEWRMNIPDLNKILFLNDIHSMIHSLQNVIESFDISFVDIYLSLAESADQLDFLDTGNMEEEEYRVSSAKARKVSYAIENYFIKANAILDYFCKLCFELEHRYEDFSKIPRLISRNKTYGNRKALHIQQKKHTIFEYDETIKLIGNIRNQVIHNGSLDSKPVVFYREVKGQAVERYALFPDTTDGHLDTWINRNKFYGKHTKVNDILPEIHNKFCHKILYTIEYILKNNATT